MELTFRLCKQPSCKLLIQGLEYDGGSYLTSSILTADNTYTYTETATVNIIQTIDSEEKKTYVNHYVNKHLIVNEEAYPDETEVELEKDGLYEITHIIIPTVAWYKQYTERTDKPELYYNSIYLYDEDNDALVKVSGKFLKKIDIEELLEVNVAGTTISSLVKNTFSTCRLENCLYELTKNLLPKLCKECNYQKYSQDIRNRDFIWMGLHTIRYSLQLGQYYQAQSFLEFINSCGSVCKTLTEHKKTSGCGCSKE